MSANPQVITEMVEKVKENCMLLGMSMNTNSIILYVPQDENINTLFNQIHQITINNKETIAMAVKKDLVFIKTSGVGLEETHGIIGKISEDLRVNGINISGILTITSSILLFVDWNEKEKALKLIKNSLKNTLRWKKMNEGKTRRLKRIMQQDNRTVIVPMDHGVTIGPIQGITNMQTITNQLIKGKVDAILVHKGIAKRIDTGRRRLNCDAVRHVQS